MNKRSYGSNFMIGSILVVFLQPWLVVGGLLYNDLAHYGPSVAIILFLILWVSVFLSSLWCVFIKFRQALALAQSASRKSLILLVIIIGIMMAGFVSYPLFVNPVGARWVPAEEPNENRRIVHELGFSIVSPPGWKARMWNSDLLGAGISLGPGYKGRHGPWLGVSTLVSPPDLSQFHETRFLDLKAFERTVSGRGENARLTHELVVAAKDQWYRVGYSESRAFETDPSLEFPEIMERYVRSFRPTP